MKSVLLTGASRRGAASGPEHIVRATRSAVNSAAPAAADAENSQGEVGGEQVCQSINHSVGHQPCTAQDCFSCRHHRACAHSCQTSAQHKH